MKRLPKYVHLAHDYHLAFPLGAVIALLWANQAPDSYFQTRNLLSFWVNQVGMSFFFALLTQEVLEATEPHGALHAWGHRALPALAAAGGVGGTILVHRAYLNIVDEVMLIQAWPVAAAVDVVLSYSLAKLIFRRRSAIAFIVVMAVISDLIVWPFAAVTRFGAEWHAWGVVLILIAMAAMAAVRRLPSRLLWPCAGGCAALSWAGCYASGLHPAMAFVPLVPFLPHTPRDRNLFTDIPDRSHPATTHLERILTYPVSVIVFLFALINGGVVLQGFEPGTWAIPVAAIVGRVAGALSAMEIAIAAGLKVPVGWGRATFFVMVLAASSGFVFSLFAATTLLPVGILLTQVRAGALATGIGAVLAVCFARILRIGRFARASAA